MPVYDFAKMFGPNFKDFGEIGPGLRIVYALANQQFPTGYIGDKNTPANMGHKVVEEALACKFGFICHLRLSHNIHNIVTEESDVPREGENDRFLLGESPSCDGLIARRARTPLVVETFLGDYACVVVSSQDWVGYLHIGQPEIMAKPNLIENFFKQWPSRPEETRVWIGPSIGGLYYEYLAEIPDRFKRFMVTTVWNTQGFCLLPAIIEEISQYGLVDGWQMHCSDIDPYSVNEKGDHSWAASVRWYERKGRELGFPIHSPRNAAILFVEGY